MSEESNHWVELPQGGDLGVEFDCEGGGQLVFEAEDTCFDMLVEDDEATGKRRIRVPMTEEDFLWIGQLLKEKLGLR